MYIEISVDTEEFATTDLINIIAYRNLSKKETFMLLDSIDDDFIKEYDYHNQIKKSLELKCSLELKWKDQLFEEQKDKFTYWELEKLLNR